MFNNFDDFTRRILNFSAVRPCESVNPATLLSSLINLTHKILCDYKKSNLFSSNKRNTNESIRLIRNLVIFLEEIRTGSSILSDSVVLSLSELHFIFQKIEFLLEDCARNGAKLFMLMKSERVSDQIRMLIRAIGVALDVLQLDSVDVSFEVKELVDLVKSQALRSRIGVENDDTEICTIVFSILRCFEDGIVPKSSDLRRVLEHLGIQTWSQCNEEIKFLESEILLDNLTTEKKDLGLLSSLTSLMTYFRCVHFMSVECSVATQESDVSSCKSEVIKSLNSDDFRCPISLEVMLDPVTIATGHTYDRSSILKWFKEGNPTCPKTGETLICVDLVPNLAMKELIKQYCLESGIAFAQTSRQYREKTKILAAGSKAAKEAIKLLAIFLNGKLVNGIAEEQSKAAYESQLLTKTSNFNRACLVDAGVIPHLLNLLCSKDLVKQENASASLLNLSKYSESKRILVENGGMELVLDVVQNGLKMEARQHAAGMLFYLASVEEYRIMIGEIPWAIPALMELLVEGTFCAKKNALVTILGLLLHHDNHWKVLSAGVVPLLLNLLGSLQREELVADCLAILATLAEKLDGAMVILRARVLHQIVEVFGFSITQSVKENCVSLLLALCINGGADVVLVLVKNQALMGPLYSLLADGSSKASRKASSLIRILHEFNEKSSSGLMKLPLQHDRFIHVW